MSRTVPQAGDLRERITVERFEEAGQDASGARSGSWAVIGAFWTSVRPAPGTTGNRDGRAVSMRTRRLIVRDEVDIRPGDRVLHNSSRFDVIDVRPERPNSRFLVVEAEGEEAV